MRRCVGKPVTRSGWARYYGQRAATQGVGSHACTLSTWFLLLSAAFGD